MSATAKVIAGCAVTVAVAAWAWFGAQRLSEDESNRRHLREQRAAAPAVAKAGTPSAPAPVVSQAELDGYARLGLTSEEQQRVTRILSVERAAVMKAFAGPEAGRRERVGAAVLAAEEDMRRELGDRYEAYARARLDRLAGLADGGAP